MKPVEVEVLGELTHPTAPGFPSPLVGAEVRSINDPTQRHVIRIPSHELFRVRNILQAAEYCLPRQPLLRSPPIVVDIGANIGLFALYAKLLYPTSVVHCFEPAPATVELLRENVGTLPHVSIYPFALGNGDANRQLFLHRRNTGENSLHPKAGDMNYDHVVNIELRDAGRQFEALGLVHVDVLKIDTEGCEIEILESLGPRLDHITYVLVEYHSDRDRRRIDAFLENFSLYGARGVQMNLGVFKYKNRAVSRSSLDPPTGSP
jgi:FkbM family methyltransferase